MTVYLGPTAEQLALIPAVLKLRRQWVLWRGEEKPNDPTKLNKIPMNPSDLSHASSTDALTWGTFADCVAALPTALEEWEHRDPTGYRGGGLGYVTTQDDPYVGVDLDHCVNDTTGAIAAWATTYVERLASYTEITPSTTGLRIWVQASLPPGHNRKGDIEMYSTGRFFTVTGWHLPETPATIEARQKPLQGLWAEVFGPQIGDRVICCDEQGNDRLPFPRVIDHLTIAPDGDTYAQFRADPALAECKGGWPLFQCRLAQPEPAAAPSLPPLDDTQVITLARTANSGAKFAALWDGKWREVTNSQGHPYPSQSEADLAFCGMLCDFTQDPEQINRIYRMSNLMRPKWNRQAYAQQTIQTAINGHIYKATLLVGTRQTASSQPQRVVTPRRLALAVGTVLAGAVVGLAGIYGIGGLKGNAPGAPACRPAADLARALMPLIHGEVAALTPASAGLRIPDLSFQDPSGQTRRLSEWRGKTVLLNLWATWCVPCRREMPALDSLQAQLGGPQFEVVAINIDTNNLDRPRNWLRDAGIAKLGFFSDSKARVFQELKAIGRAAGMPTSVLIDPSGCEIGTMAGPAEWASDDAVKLLTASLSR